MREKTIRQKQSDNFWLILMNKKKSVMFSVLCFTEVDHNDTSNNLEPFSYGGEPHFSVFFSDTKQIRIHQVSQLIFILEHF